MFHSGNRSNRAENLSTEIDDVHEETRRNEERSLRLPGNHVHDADGNAVFTAPAGSEPTGTNPH